MAIISIGSVLVDRVCAVPRLPQSGGGIISESFFCTLGGSSFNTARIINQLGGSCFLFAPLGVGPHAQFIAPRLEEAGLSGTPVSTDKDNGSCICLIEPDGERSMITLRGIEGDFNDSWFDGFDASPYTYGVTCGYELLSPGYEAILRFYEAHPHITLVFAPGPCIDSFASDVLRRINALRPIWHLNSHEALTYTATTDLREAGLLISSRCRNVSVITDGPRGSYAFIPEEGQEPQTIFAPGVEIKPVDTIGAGDAHIGAVLAAREAGYSWEDALDLANRVSANICRVAGATLNDEEFAHTDLHL